MLIDRPLRRSLLFVPGTEPRRIEKSKTSGADAIILDLEDSVSIDRKDEARQLVADSLKEGGFEHSETVVRVNAPDTPFFKADLAAVVLAGVQTVMIPKSEALDVVAAIAERLQVTRNNQGNPVRILALVESALGVLRAAEIANSHILVDGLCFGHADFSLNMGIPVQGAEKGIVLHGRCQLALAAKAFGKAALDNICLAVKDEAIFREDALLGQQLGFDGKMCIHPTQVKIVNEIYTPTQKQIQFAQQVVDGWNEAKSKGMGVFTLNNKMIDAPVAIAQENVLKRAQQAGVL